MTRGRLLVATVVVLAIVVVVVTVRQLTDDADSYDAGDDRFADYCAEVEDQQQGIGEAVADGGDSTGLIGALPAFRILAEEAPRDIADEWRTVVDRVGDLESALADARVDPDDYDPEEPAADLTEAARERIDAAAAALVAPDTRTAFNAVSQHARDVCHQPLSL